MISSWVGGKVTGLRNRVVDAFLDRYYHIHTTGAHLTSVPDANRYETVAYSLIFKILQRLQLSETDVLLDLGCGKGRVLCCAAQFSLKTIIGIDASDELCDIARRNAKRLRGCRSPVIVKNVFAQQYNYDEASVIYLFNPFGEDTFKHVLGLISDSVRRHPRQIRIAYTHPVHESVLIAYPAFKLYDNLAARPWNGVKFNVSFWKHEFNHEVFQ